MSTRLPESVLRERNAFTVLSTLSVMPSSYADFLAAVRSTMRQPSGNHIVTREEEDLSAGRDHPNGAKGFFLALSGELIVSFYLGKWKFQVIG